MKTKEITDYESPMTKIHETKIGAVLCAGSPGGGIDNMNRDDNTEI